MFSMKKSLPRIKNYFRRNPETLFIVVFQVLLLVCVGLLISGNSFWAEGLAVVAYFSLVIGVVLQLISFLRHRESESEENER
jgi:fumarate reductase subunit C